MKLKWAPPFPKEVRRVNNESVEMCNNNLPQIFKGDTENNFIKIDLVNNTDFEIYKAIFQCGNLQKVYENPIFPLIISFTREESKQLDFNSTCYLAVENEQGEKFTARGKGEFLAKREVVKDVWLRMQWN